MSALADELRARAARAGTSLAAARRAGDEYLVRVRVGELEELARLAADNGVELGQAADQAVLAEPDVVDLPLDDVPPDAAPSVELPPDEISR